MTKHAQITGTHIMYGNDPQTHVKVEVFEVISAGVRRRIDALDISLPGATDDHNEIRSGTETVLISAGLLSEGDRVLTEAEARAAMIAGVNP